MAVGGIRVITGVKLCGEFRSKKFREEKLELRRGEYK
ncbi:hypothetical protein CDSM653_00836 [Caldanaerobacter subterraneus subsp. pacificus DSM 12653]|uniref:Uncharacterized protein n=1 Tax=Caldanaerobacter subterraneus subsp. pacificus DSM 12653 TaxID=391606 RepID=A0A0F5PNF1_9THEO|nr:hypothetical protein CDSM653_00836 [Caldanaerobacter subterraneus subsp. pacificus DSM 12653]